MTVKIFLKRCYGTLLTLVAVTLRTLKLLVEEGLYVLALFFSKLPKALHAIWFKAAADDEDLTWAAVCKEFKKLLIDE